MFLNKSSFFQHVSNRRRLRMVSMPDAGTVALFSVIALLVIVVSFAIMFGFDFTYGDTSIDVKLIELVIVGDGQTSDIVHGNIIFTVDKRSKLLLTGDVWEVNMLWSDSKIDTIAVKDGVSLISYDGFLILNEPASAGDDVEILIRNGGSETAVTATLGSET